MAKGKNKKAQILVSQHAEKSSIEQELKQAEPLFTDSQPPEKAKEADFRIEQAYADLKKKEAALEDAYQAKLDKLKADEIKLGQALARIDARELAVLEMEGELNAKKEQIKKEALAEIRADEQKIRAAESTALRNAWEQKVVAQRKALQAEISSQREAAAREFEQAHTARIEAESEKLARIHEADAEIQRKYQALSDEYQAKLDALRTTQKELQRQKADYEYEREELEGEREYIQNLKQRYEKCSETEVQLLRLKLSHLEDINKASQEQISLQSKRIAQLEVHALDHSGQNAQDRIDELERLLATATSQLDEYSNLPSPSRIAELQYAEEALRTQKLELDEAKAQLITVQTQLSAYALDKRELENARTTSAALQALNEQLQKKLQFIAEQYKNSHESKFKGLLEIDAERYVPSTRESFKGTLKDLVTYIRNYGANPPAGQTPLYYSEETIRVFLASLAASEPASRLIILQGLSGTGKSSLPQLFRNALDIRWHSISVQPSWRDNRELLGYDNDFTNRFKETEFTKALYRASSGEYKDDIFLIVLDEMNLARIEYYFADFLSELEHRNAEWKIPLVSTFAEPNKDQRPMWLNYDSGAANLIVKKNIWFVGTANNDDSTSLITDKVYDRAQILDMDEREAPFEKNKVKPITIDFGTLSALFANARKTKAYQMTQADWDTLNEIDKEFLQPMDITFGNRMKNQLDFFVPVYVACGGTKEGAIDYFLAHKILRKLDEKYDAYIVGCLDDLAEMLNAFYGDGVFVKCLKKISMIKHRNFNAGDV